MSIIPTPSEQVRSLTDDLRNLTEALRANQAEVVRLRTAIERLVQEKEWQRLTLQTRNTELVEQRRELQQKLRMIEQRRGIRSDG